MDMAVSTDVAQTVKVVDPATLRQELVIGVVKTDGKGLDVKQV